MWAPSRPFCFRLDVASLLASLWIKEFRYLSKVLNQLFEEGVYLWLAHQPRTIRSACAGMAVTNSLNKQKE